MRARAALGLVVVGLLVLTACAPLSDAAWTPPAWALSEIAVVPPAAPVDLATRPEVEASLTSYRIRNDDVGVQARFAFLSGAGSAGTAFNDRVSALVGDAVETAEARSDIEYAPAAATPGAGLGERACSAGSTTQDAAELLADPEIGVPGDAGVAVACDIVVAAGPILAQRVRVLVGDTGEAGSDTTSIVYADIATGDVASAADLWTTEAAAALASDVVEALRRAAGSLSSVPAAEDETAREQVGVALETTVLGEDGAFLFTIAPGFTAIPLQALGVSATTEPLTIGIPAEVAAPLLSPFGTRVLAAGGKEYSGPAAAPAGFESIPCALVPCVALTYDDGPSDLTADLLDELSEARAPATFFLLGASAERNPDAVRRAVGEGHGIGNHTWSHPHLPDLDDARMAAELTRTRELLQGLTGQSIDTFRPPYGDVTEHVLEVAGQPAILWTVDTRDWTDAADDEVEAAAVNDPAPGGIILFHDTHVRSVRMAPAVIEGLRDRGFSLVTVTQLFGGELPASGLWRAAG